MRRLTLTVVLLLAMVSVARSQDFESAGKHFSSAQEAFGAQHYKTAAAEFSAAYAITRDPVLLYNIGESYQKAGQGQKAVESYKRYLHDQVNAPDRAEVERRIAAIERAGYALPDQSVPGDAASTPAAPSPPATPTPPGAPGATPAVPGPAGMAPATPATPREVPPVPAPPLPASSAPSTAAPTPPTPPVAPLAPEKAAPNPTVAKGPATAPAPLGFLDDGPASKLRVGAWIGVATTLALLTAGAILGLAAESRADEINRRLSFIDSTGQPHKFDQSAAKDLKDLRSDGKLYNGLAIGFYSAAAASTVATVTMFVVDATRKKSKHQALRWAPLVGRSVAGLQLGGTF